MRTVSRLCVVMALVVAVPLVHAQDPQVFRTATNLVTVDAYPRKNGRIVDNLTREDFEILEDGVAQKIDQFEFVRVEPAPETARRDPNNQREMLELAADPHNRVFVAYLDILHTSTQGSHDIHAPFVDMLNNVIGANDLFGVTTSRLSPKFLVLGRKTQSVEEQLSKYWDWGIRNNTTGDPADPTEFPLHRCFDINPVTKPPSHRYGDDDGTKRLLTEILIDRRREEATLTNLKQLVEYVGALREARTIIVLVSDGWRLFRPDRHLIENALQEQAQWMPPSPPPVVVGPTGKIDVGTGLNENYSTAACNTELERLGMLDDDRMFRDIIALANRTNVSFYPVNAGGLEVFDRTTGQEPVPMIKDLAWHQVRVDSARTLAENTNGLAVVNTNDLRAGLGKIADDVSAYYLLGYYSTNKKTDGKFREIKVRVKQQNVNVAARRGYLAGGPGDAAAAASARASAGASAANTVDVSASRNALPNLESADLFAYGVASGDELLVVAEVSSKKVEAGQWTTGATVNVVATAANGDQAGTATARIEPGTRSALLHVPLGAGAGPWRVGVTITGSAGTLDERINVNTAIAKLIGSPMLYRGASTARATLRPVADFLFHRTERLHLEVPVLKPIDSRSARILDQRGQAMPFDVTATERDDNGHAMLTVDLNLAPLSPGEYVLELVAGSGTDSERRLVAFRLVR